MQQNNFYKIRLKRDLKDLENFKEKNQFTEGIEFDKCKFFTNFCVIFVNLKITNWSMDPGQVVKVNLKKKIKINYLKVLIKINLNLFSLIE
jgi:hypothetical protein